MTKSPYEQLPPKDGLIESSFDDLNASLEFDQNDARCPKGFRFFANYSLDDNALELYRNQPDKYVICNQAYDGLDGQLMEGFVAVFEKGEPVTKEK